MRAASHVSRAAMRAAVGSPKYLLIAKPAEAGAVRRSFQCSAEALTHQGHLMALCLRTLPFMHVMHLQLSLGPQCGAGDGRTSGSRLNGEIKQQKVEGKRWEKPPMPGLHSPLPERDFGWVCGGTVTPLTAPCVLSDECCAVCGRLCPAGSQLPAGHRRCPAARRSLRAPSLHPGWLHADSSRQVMGLCSLGGKDGLAFRGILELSSMRSLQTLRKGGRKSSVPSI